MRKKKNKPRKKDKNPQDQELCLTKGQLCNIVDAAAKKKGACPKAKQFVKELKEEIREAKKAY